MNLFATNETNEDPAQVSFKPSRKSGREQMKAMEESFTKSSPKKNGEASEKLSSQQRVREDLNLDIEIQKREFTGLRDFLKDDG